MQFLELSIPASDVVDSLRWYKSIGFADLPVGETRRYHYAVVSDGDLCIGLHGGGITGIALSFVRPELATYVRHQQQRGYEFAYTRLGPDEFHEAGRMDPDGNLAMLLEARSFSPASELSAPPLTGMLEQICLPCTNLHAAIDFWQDYGFMAVETETAGQADLYAPGLRVSLREDLRQPELQFRPTSLRTSLARLAAGGTTPRAAARDYVLEAPEGTRFRLLGE